MGLLMIIHTLICIGLEKRQPPSRTCIKLPHTQSSYLENIKDQDFTCWESEPQNPGISYLMLNLLNHLLHNTTRVPWVSWATQFTPKILKNQNYLNFIANCLHPPNLKQRLSFHSYIWKPPDKIGELYQASHKWACLADSFCALKGIWKPQRKR